MASGGAQEYLKATVCLFLSPHRPEVTILSPNQRRGCVARIIRHPFQASQYPNGGVLKTRAKRVRLSPGHAHFWRWKRNPYRTFANRTVPHPAVDTRQYSPRNTQRKIKRGKKVLRWPGIEPGSTAWKAAMLTTIPPMPQ